MTELNTPVLKVEIGEDMVQEEELYPGLKIIPIYLTKGDNVMIRIAIRYSSGAKFDLTDTDKVRLKVKQNLGSTTILLNREFIPETPKTDGLIKYTFVAEDYDATHLKSAGNFIGEVEITQDNAKVYTAKQRLQLRVLEEL